MTRIVVLSALLAVSLVGSYLTWTDDAPERQGGEVFVYQAGPNDLQAVSWVSEKLDVRLEKRKDAKGEYFWLVATERKEVPVVRPDAEAGADEEAEPEDAESEPADDDEQDEAEEEEADASDDEGEEAVEIEEETIAFHGGEAAEKLWATLAPLAALRQLTLPEGFDRSVLGFEGPEATLEVQRGSGPLELVIGSETWGSKDRYVKRGEEVFLVDDQTLRPLQFAKTRLVERRLHPRAEGEVSRVVVRYSGRETAFIQTNRDDRAKAYWAVEATPDEEHKSAGLWLGKLFRMRLQHYVDEATVEQPLEERFAFTVEGEGEAWTVTVLQAEGENDFYARTEFNRSLVKLTRSLASDAAADVETLFDSGDPSELENSE